ncbi:MAG: Nickel-dependent superoxide dismutase, partial [uncultured Frankineae bacterium]
APAPHPDPQDRRLGPLRPSLRRLRPRPGPHRGAVRQGHAGEVPRQRGPGLPRPRAEDHRRPGHARQAPPRRAVARLLQGRALREVPRPAHADQQHDQAGQRHRRQAEDRPGRGPEAPGRHRPDRDDLLGDQGQDVREARGV